MVIDTTVFPTDKYPTHNCGKVLDFCIYENTRIFFCIFCKKVTGAAKESQISITIKLNEEDIGRQMKEYDKENLREWV